MKIPLGVGLNKDKMFVMRNGKFHVLETPTLDVVIPNSMNKKGLYPTAPDDYYHIGLNKWSPKNPGQTNGFAPSCIAPLDHQEWKESFANSLPYNYTDHMCVTKKELFNSYPHEGPITLMYWDIEVCSDGSGVFPKASKCAVAMIGYKMVEYNVETSEYKDLTDIVILDNFDIESYGEEDRQLLIDFSDAMKEHDPQVIVGYNSWKFDLPYILERMEILGIDKHDLIGISAEECQKVPNVMSHFKHAADKENDVHMAIFGKRLHYDILHIDVLRDTTLTGVKNRKMKTIAQHFYPDDENIIVLDDGIENILAMMGNEKDKERLRDYLRSDIIQTDRLSSFYFGTNVEQAMQLNIPLSIILNRRNGTIPTLYLLTELFAENMIPLRSNVDVFEYLTKRAEHHFGEEKFFQGAYVDVCQTGKMPFPLYKHDFQSLYPNTIRTFNISYETVTTEFELLEGEVSDDLDTYEADFDGKILTISYNDKVLHARITVKIDQTRRGIVPKIMDRLLEGRKKVKNEMKNYKHGSLEYSKADTLQLFLKIVANSLYGILSQRTGIGYLPMGATITALGRWATKSVCVECNTPESNIYDDTPEDIPMVKSDDIDLQAEFAQKLADYDTTSEEVENQVVEQPKPELIDNVPVKMALFEDEW